MFDRVAQTEAEKDGEAAARSPERIAALEIAEYHLVELTLAPPMIERSATTVLDFIKVVLELRNSWCPGEKCPDLWFRGVTDKSHKLLPGAYRIGDYDENSNFLEFKNLVPPYLAREPVDDWEWYYLAQHYGIRTRLLDWTENALAALYFATEPEDAAVPCVWMMDPRSLNKLSSSDSNPPIFVPTIEGSMRFWLPDNCDRNKPEVVDPQDEPKGDNSKPLAIFPRRHDRRIAAQRGVFTVHGASDDPIEEVFVQGGLYRLARIDLRIRDRHEIRNDLWALGINKTAVFPEPTSVAEDIARRS